MIEVQQDFENMVQTILGVTQQGPPQDRGTRPGAPPFPSLPLGFAGQQQPHAHVIGPMGFIGTILQGLGGTRVQAGGDMNAGGPFALLQRMMDPANAAHGDAVFSQEALDRVITQLMEQHQGSTAPGPAPESAIKSLPKKKVDKDMLDDNGKAECSICMDSVEVGDQVTLLPCTHWFHQACITAWLKEHDTCPHCRKGIATPADTTSRGAATSSPSRPSQRRSGSSNVMSDGWQENPGTTSRTPMVVPDTSSPPPPDIRTARLHHYRRPVVDDLERSNTHTQGRTSSRSTPSSPQVRRHHSTSHRSGSRSSSGGGSGSGSGSGGGGGGSSGGFGSWVRSFGSGGGGSGGGR